MTEEIINLLNKYNIDKVIMEEVLAEDIKNNQTVFKALMYLQAFICHTLNKFKITPTFVVASH
jgi:hypothetical protein